MALVEFVEHHAAHALQTGVAQHATREHAFRQEAQARARPRHFFEAHLVPHRFAHRLAAFARHVTRRQTRGQPARFQHQYFARGIEPEQRGRYARGLPRPGRRFQHEMVGRAQVVQDLWE